MDENSNVPVIISPKFTLTSRSIQWKSNLFNRYRQIIQPYLASVGLFLG